jgi:hypothetical protein
LMRRSSSGASGDVTEIRDALSSAIDLSWASVREARRKPSPYQGPMGPVGFNYGF